MTRALVYLAGAPAAGKSALMAALTAGCARRPQARPFRHDLLLRPGDLTVCAAELGGTREAFAGTDALPLHIAPQAKAWLSDPGCPPLLLGEGDRLGHPGFLDAAARAGRAVTLVYVTAWATALEHRREQRGHPQDPAWVAGRHTKAARLADQAGAAGHLVLRVDTTRFTPAELAGRLRGQVPALAALPAAAPAVAG